MSEQISLDNVLDGKDKTEVSERGTIETPAETPPEQASADIPVFTEKPLSVRKKGQQKERDAREAGEGRVRDPETGQYVPKEAPKEELKTTEVVADAKPVEPPKQEFTDKERAFLAAAQEERHKRQELERRLAVFESAKTQEPPKQFWDDPEGTMKRNQEAVAKMVMDTRLNTAEMIARFRHRDFDEKVQVFAQIMNQVPGIYEKWIASQDPAEFAYRTADSHVKLQQAGSLDQWQADKEKEIRLKVETEMQEKQKAKDKELAAIPRTLSDARGVTQNRVQWNGPTPLDNILGK